MEQNSDATEAAQASDPQTTAPRRRSRRASAAVGEAVAPAESAASAASEAAEASGEDAAPKKRVSRARKKAGTDTDAEATGADAADAADAAPAASAEADGSAEAKAEGDAEDAAPKKRSARGRGKKAAESSDAEEAAAPKDGAKGRNSGSAEKGAKAGKAEPAGAEAGEKNDAEKSGDKNGADKNGDKNGADKNGADKNGRGGDGQSRSSRTRQRERKRRGQGDDLEPEITEDDVLLPVAGILDVLDNYAFVRTSGYLPGTNDVYVSLGQVKKYGLRKGDSVVGAIRQPREGEGGGRQKYNAIVRVDTVNSRPAEENQGREDFAALTPLHPAERLRLETGAGELTSRIIDLFAPIGKGQRGLIVGPSESGKSTALRRIAAAVAENQPGTHLMMVLIDERPEEVTELQRTVNGEVIASTFDRAPEDHVTIAELAVERAKRLVELGHDVVVLVDSLTSLARAYNALAPAASRVPAGSLDAAALYPVKKLLGAARNIENGGSLTVIATVSAQPGSSLDEAVIGELDATANMRLRLSGEAAERRVFPAVELSASSTRREELLTSEAEAKVMDQLRRSLAGTSVEQGLEAVLKRLGETSSNVEFLALAQRTQSLV